MSNYKIGFIGSGNMAYAISKGIINSNILKSDEIFMYDIDENRLSQLKSEGYPVTSEIKEIAKNCKYIFLSVLPQICGEVLSDIKDVITKESVIVSIAAGITSEFIKEHTFKDCKSVLVMPNTPLRICYASTALSAASPTTEEEFEFVNSLFKASGYTHKLSEELMKEVIPLNGSSPAFTYRLVLSAMNKAETLGIEKKAAKELLCHSMIGAAKMMLETDYTPEELIEMVSTPGGATIEGIKSLEANNLDKIISDCMEATINRAYELGKKS